MGFEQSNKLPRFSMFVPFTFQDLPQGVVQFTVATPMDRFVLWLSSSFNICFQDSVSGSLELKFRSVINGQLLVVEATEASGGGLNIVFRSENLTLASSLVQDMISSLSVKELMSK